MARPTKTAGTVRINIELSPATKDRLERLQKATESRSMVETISRALAVYDTLVTEMAQESEIIVRRKGGKELALLLVPA